MAELIRSVEEEDIPKLIRLLFRVFQDGEYVSLERLGGMTNHSYKVTRPDGQEYLLRLPGEGTEDMINRLDERKSTELACKLGIDSPLIYFDDVGRKVMRFIHNPQPMNGIVMRREENLRQAAEIFRRLHTCGVDTGVRFEVFEMADLYERIIRKATTVFYDDYEDIRKKVMDIKTIMDSQNEIRKVPCHNDSLIGNWVLDGNGRLYLIDWEYSGMNEPMWDLSCLSIEAEYAPENDDLLLSTYFEREVSTKEKKHFIAAKIYVDYLWTLWGLTRVPYDGLFMQEYADIRYKRLKRNIEAWRMT